MFVLPLCNWKKFPQMKEKDYKRMTSTVPTPSTSLDHPMLSCSEYSKNDQVKYGYNPTVIDLTVDTPPPSTMAHQPLRHMPHHQHPHSAFHRVTGQPYDSHGPMRGCPYLQAQSSREPHHHSHYRSIHRVSNPSYCPSMSSTVPLQHPPVAATPVILDPDQLPNHVRTVPITSFPNRLLVNSVPMATPTYVQPQQSENPELEVNPSNHQHYHHHYHHHHHHHHHFVQPPYQVPQPQPPQPQPYHPHPYPSSQMHHRHYRRWQSNQEWSQPVNHHQQPPTVHSASVQTYPDLLYHLLSVMSMQPVSATHPIPQQPVWEEAYQQENYETLLNLAEQIGEAKPKGLTRAEIDQLQTFRVTAESKKRNDDGRCVVCLADFDEKQLVRRLPCSHDYHTRCIDKWLKSNRTCPICRTEVKVGAK